MRRVSGASASASEPTIHLALAIADGERRAAARADEQIVLAGEEHHQGESAFEPRQRLLDRLLGR